MSNYRFLNRIRGRIRRWLLEGEERSQEQEFRRLRGAVLELNDSTELKKAFGWKNDPILDDPAIHEYDYLEDANERRIRDAETLGLVVSNTHPAICLEIGTAGGHSTALMAVNARQCRVYTVNIDPEEILSGKGGILTTVALEREKIGAYYRDRGLANITQIFANTAHWEPDMGPIDVAFIDGCHDTEFVYNDTRKILPKMRPGGFIVWHDFNPALTKTFHWIHDVCMGVEELYVNGLIKGRILHVRDSWMGVYRTPLKPDRP